MKAILLLWVPKLKKASAVVLDNAPSHVKLRDWLASLGLRILKQAPYMNLCENAHADIKRNPCAEASANNKKLLEALQASWAGYDPPYFQRTYVEKYALD